MAQAALLSVFAGHNARRLLAVRLLGQAGDGLLQTSLATFVLFSPQREANPGRVALAFAVLLLPYSLVGPLVGIFIDRWSRRTILIRANLVRSVAMFGVGLLIWHNAANLPLAVLVLVSLGVNRFTQAALAASLPHVVRTDQLVPGNALFPTLGTVCASIAVGVGITTQKVLGNTDSTNAALAFAAIGLALSAAATGRLITPADALGPHGVTGRVLAALGNVISGLIDGLRVLRSRAIVVRCLLAVAAQRFAFGVLTVHVLLLARNVWHPTSDPDAAVTDFGLAAGLAALGAGIAALTSASLLADRPGHPSRWPRLTRTTSAAALAAIPATAAAITQSARIAVLATACGLAFVGQLLKIASDTAIQQNIDDAHRGRVFSLSDMTINLSLVLGIALYALNAGLRLQPGATAVVLVTALTVATALSGAASRTARATTR